MDEEILKTLRQYPEAFVSGERISRALGISRTAVWKRVKHLRALGYEIEASRRVGYRLMRSPDLLTPLEIQSVLRTKWMGKTIHYFHSVDSTNSAAYQLALRGSPEGEIVIAESQEKGKGRLGRNWFSPPFLNLHLSIILRPPIPPRQASLITLMAAVAVAEGIERFSGLHPMIKWPNDILLGNRKVAGLLNEIHSESDRINFMILGIGANLNAERRMFPKEIRLTATSLREEMRQRIQRKVFLQFLLEALERWYETFLKKGGGPVLKAWRDWAQIKGKHLSVVSFGERWAGRAVDVDSEGRLILETASGERKRIVAGDVEYREE